MCRQPTGADEILRADGGHAVKLTVLFALVLLLQGCSVAGRYQRVDWSNVEGWRLDRPEEAWPAFLASCERLGRNADWAQVCDLARQQPAAPTSSDARAFFERHLTPYRVNGKQGLITGYYEPILRGARARSPEFGTPLYAVPDDLLTIDLAELYPELKGRRVRGKLSGRRVVPYSERAQIAGSTGIVGKEIVWVDSAVDAFFLEIQGSGRVQLPDGQVIRLAYADQNGHPYAAIGRYLVGRGELTLEEVSAPRIREWLRTHPDRLHEVLNSNPSVVFFREEPLGDPTQGPRGSLNVPLTAGRSIAIDATRHPLGAPFFVATTEPGSEAPLEKLVLAQDTGGAIRGDIRADLFFGLGPEAGEAAGNMKQPGRMWLLWPNGTVPPN
jgi:membrane-bound lytic murein transglycosylase A